MANYSIRDLENITGIKAHTIRIWEKRYNLFEPTRTETNLRRYTEADLRKLLNISILNNSGYKISELSTCNNTELNERVSNLDSKLNYHNQTIDFLTAAMIDMDLDRIEMLLYNAEYKIGFEQTYKEILYPFLAKIGILWQTGVIEPFREHFVSNIIRRKIIGAIENSRFKPRHNAPTAVLFLPEHELHELGLLYYEYLLKREGYKTIYLGQIVPFINLVELAKLTQFDLMICSLTMPFPKSTPETYIEALLNDLPGKKILVTGLAAQQVTLNAENLHVFNNPDALIELLNTLY